MVKLFVPIKSESLDISSNLSLSDLQIESRFGKTPYYLLYDTNTEEMKFLKNQNHHFGGNIHPFVLAKKNEAEAVIALHLGYTPYQGFKEQGIPIYRGESRKNLQEVVNSFVQGQKELLEEPESGSCCSNH